MESWYEIKNQSDDSVEVAIVGDIGGGWFGDGVTLKGFKKDWDKVKNSKSITLTLNSVGGSVFDGIAMYELIAKQRDRVSVEVLGIAASIASVIALSGSKLVMGSGAYYMIHNPFGAVMGDAEDMRKTADTLDKIRGTIVSIYEPRTALNKGEIEAAMDAETWYTAEEAVEAGFADEISGVEAKVAASADVLERFRNVPESILKPPEKPEIDVAAIAAKARAVGRLEQRLAMLGGH